MNLEKVQSWDDIKYWYAEIIIKQPYESLSQEVQTHLTTLLENIERISKLSPSIFMKLFDDTFMDKLRTINTEIYDNELEEELPESVELLDELLSNFGG